MSARRRMTIEAVLEANTYRLAKAKVEPPPGNHAIIDPPTLNNVAREIDAALGNDHEEPLRNVRYQQRYRWIGIPGQGEWDGELLQIQSLQAGGRLNTIICTASGDVEPVLSSIGVTDLAACLQAGWLVLEEEQDGSRPEQLVRLPLLSIEEAHLLLGGLRTDEAMSDSRPDVRPILDSLRSALAEAILTAERQGGDQ